MHALRIQPREQGHHVGHVSRDLVTARVGQPIGLPAPNHIDTHHAVLSAHRLRQRVEVTRLPRKPMRADEHARVDSVAPLPVSHPVQAAHTEALNVVQAG